MPGNSLNIDLPTIGVTSGPEYATMIDAALRVIILDLEAKITPDEILVNANLDFASFGNNYSAVNLRSINFRSLSSELTGADVNAFYSLNGQATFRDGAGNNVALTAAGAVAGAAGNITTSGTPAYATGGIQLQWIGGDSEYRFKSGSDVNAYANLVMGEVHHRNGANTFKIKSAVTTDYDITWPAVAPDDNDLAYFLADGTIAFSDTIPGDKTFSGNVTVGGIVKHPEEPLIFSPISAEGGTWNGNGYRTITSGTSMFIGVDIPAGATIESLRIRYRHSVTGVGSPIAMSLYGSIAGVKNLLNSAVGEAVVASPSATVWATFQTTTLIGQPALENLTYFVEIQNVSGTTDIANVIVGWKQT